MKHLLATPSHVVLQLDWKRKGQGQHRGVQFELLEASFRWVTYVRHSLLAANVTGQNLPEPCTLQLIALESHVK